MRVIQHRLIIRTVRLRFDTEAEAVTPMVHIIADVRRKGFRGGPALKILLIGLIIGLGGFGSALAQEPGQRTFATPQAAAAALAAAAQTNNEQEMLAILGPSARDLISSGDPVADQRRHQFFARRYDELHQFASDSEGRVFLYVGAESWPTPIPLEKHVDQWFFDTAYGKQEVLYRRIGFNELYAIKVCSAIVKAQREYYAGLHGDSVHQYAQSLRSEPGTQDGLYWPVKQGEPQSPLGPLVAEASRQGYQHHTGGQPHPFHGYIYGLLKSQDASAPGGARSYIVEGKMTGGFGLIAYPANYRDSGVMTFLVNQDGQIYQKDLGPQTEQIASSMTAYNADDTWSRVDTSLYKQAGGGD
jgi:Protein of unknown function (DUF2950)